jgi:hypothetical protein
VTLLLLPAQVLHEHLILQQQQLVVVLVLLCPTAVDVPAVGQWEACWGLNSH